MKTFEVKSNIGEGLFTEDAVAVQLSFTNGTTEVYELYALTRERVIALQKSGVSFRMRKQEELDKLSVAEREKVELEAYENGKKIGRNITPKWLVSLF